MPLPDADAVAPSNPKELINAYLLSKGMQPTNALMSQALMANAQNPGTIPGLVNMEPISSPGDPGMPPAPARGGGPARVPGASTRANTEDRSTRAIPGAGAPGDNLGGSIMDWLLPLLGGGAGAAAALAGRRYLQGGAPKPAADEPKRLTGPDDGGKGGGGGSGDRLPPPEGPRGGAPAIAAPDRPAIAAPPERLALPAPAQRALPAPNPIPSPLDTALDRAVEPGKVGPPPDVPPVAEPKAATGGGRRGTVTISPADELKNIRPRTNLGLPTALEGKGAAQLEEFLRWMNRVRK